jgi:hypothetical protein
VVEAGGGTGGLSTEIVWTSDRLGQGAALNAGVRRAPGPIVILLDSSVEPTGDFVTPLTAALADPAVALAGGWGIVSGDLRRFEEAPPGRRRRDRGLLPGVPAEDFATRGPFDERFRFYRNLDIWWSLVLRDEGEGTAPRVASRWPTCPSPDMSTAATRACRPTNGTARASATSTGSSTASAPGRDLLIGADRRLQTDAFKEARP